MGIPLSTLRTAPETSAQKAARLGAWDGAREAAYIALVRDALPQDARALVWSARLDYGVQGRFAEWQWGPEWRAYRNAYATALREAVPA